MNFVFEKYYFFLLMSVVLVSVSSCQKGGEPVPNFDETEIAFGGRIDDVVKDKGSDEKGGGDKGGGDVVGGDDGEDDDGGVFGGGTSGDGGVFKNVVGGDDGEDDDGGVFDDGEDDDGVDSKKV